MLTEAQRAAFDRLGLVRLPGAFTGDEATAMQDLVWDALRHRHGISRTDPSTWRREHATGLHDVTDHAVFAPIAGPALRNAIDALLGPGTWNLPRRWGQLVVTFPVADRAWDVPSEVRHVDFSWAMPAEPLPRVKVFTFVSDVPPGGGGTLVVSGSHRLIGRFVQGRPPEVLENTRRMRLEFLASHPWLRALASPTGTPDRSRRFMDVEEDVDGVPVRVVELTGRAGDIVLTHPWLLHCRAPNCADAPRLMRAKDIYRRTDDARWAPYAACDAGGR